MELQKDESLKFYWAPIAAVIFWGLSFVATKIALRSFPPFTLIFFRFSLGALFFLIIMTRRGWPRLTLNAHVRVFFIALMQPGSYFICETFGLQYTSAAKTGLIIATIPVVVPLLAMVLIGERTPARQFWGIGLSFAGIAALVLGDPNFTFQLEGAIIGDMLIFGAVLSAAFYIVFTRNLSQNYSPLDITCMQTIYGAIFFTPGCLLQWSQISWATVGTDSLAALAYLTVFATVAAFLCYNYGLSKLPATRVAVFINAIPVVALLAAFLILGERLAVPQLTGAVLVLAGVYLTNRLKAKR
jgi:drug/metabolite transporter (DMT)-like permease